MLFCHTVININKCRFCNCTTETALGHISIIFRALVLTYRCQAELRTAQRWTYSVDCCSSHNTTGPFVIHAMLRHGRRWEQQRLACQQSISLPFWCLSADEKRGDDIFGHGDGTNPKVIQKSLVSMEILKLDDNVFCLDTWNSWRKEPWELVPRAI